MENGINLFPLFLSLQVASLATVIGMAVGLPVAYYLSRSTSRLADVADTLLTLPIVLPPTVLGYYLLVLLGRNSALGVFLEEQLNIMLVFTPAGAVVAASVVSAPFFIKSARAAFSEIDKDMINAAKLLGRSNINIIFSIIIPLAWRGMLSGIILTFARALGDFGTTLMVSGSIPNYTTTMPIAIYDALQAGNKELTNVLVFIMTAVAVVCLFSLNRLEKKMGKGRNRRA
ncbi:Molybdenum transport system permease protein ModB [Bacillus thermotolerans]|uniref:Molybdenum transport system permease n=1 Tax=Bacillus thermotolerans TaxID=1221996 RepID=A0A0F5I265_BACTR|nr:molybdate ABC transporter permease subunit [Bacillus thermotolerans]KKB36895.1 Molybdenum transport system permease protein ModB [Bacillus thermotolerans]KKB39611.1 Molybdenum transport system permease protein ModB [Bacillus thermotolerans]KKB44463.1 Molybdenum transport system permease protein ModB [Bacillus thermotolerans]